MFVRDLCLWSSILKSQLHSCRMYGLQRWELTTHCWQGDNGEQQPQLTPTSLLLPSSSISVATSGMDSSNMD